MKISTQQNNGFPVINQFVAVLKLTDFDFNSLENLQKKADEISQRLSLTVVKKEFHKFDPQGITLVYFIAQSHMVLHTWPEYNMLHIDLFSCSETIKQEMVERVLHEVFTAQHIDHFEIKKIHY